MTYNISFANANSIKSQIEQPETFTKFREKHMYRNLGMEYCNFIKIDTSTQVFSVTF